MTTERPPGFASSAKARVREHFAGGNRQLMVYGWLEDGSPGAVFGLGSHADPAVLDARKTRLVERGILLGFVRWAGGYADPDTGDLLLTIVEDGGHTSYRATCSGLPGLPGRTIGEWVVVNHSEARCLLCGTTDPTAGFISDEMCVLCLADFPSLAGLGYIGDLIAQLAANGEIWDAFTQDLDLECRAQLDEATAWLVGIARKLGFGHAGGEP